MYAGIYYGQAPVASTATYVPYSYTPVTGAVKNKDMWTNSDIKSLNKWTLTPKNITLFKPQLAGATNMPYTYSSPTITYDSPLVQYDYIYTAGGNQLNQLVSTKWTEKYV